MLCAALYSVNGTWGTSAALWYSVLPVSAGGFNGRAAEIRNPFCSNNVNVEPGLLGFSLASAGPKVFSRGPFECRLKNSAKRLNRHIAVSLLPCTLKSMAAASFLPNSNFLEHGQGQRICPRGDPLSLRLH